MSSPEYVSTDNASNGSLYKTIMNADEIQCHFVECLKFIKPQEHG
jgi:hypothetical protein